MIDGHVAEQKLWISFVQEPLHKIQLTMMALLGTEVGAGIHIYEVTDGLQQAP
jgi:hypothetical protein